MLNVQVNRDRLWQSLMDLARIGATEKGGVRRLALSELDGEGRTLVCRWFREEGLEVTVDRIGNIFARRDGADPSLPPIVSGSHIDTQPSGGKFDGNYGVMAALEVARTLNEAQLRTRAPYEVAIWTNEEGTRFTPVMMGSGVFAGAFELEYALAQRDLDGCSVQEALQPPMRLRNDALLGAARIIEGVNRIALDRQPDARATVGFVQVSPNSRDVVPGSVRVSVDMRHPRDEGLVAMEAAMRALADNVAAEIGLRAEVTRVTSYAPVRFDEGCVSAVRDAARKFGYRHSDIVSGAGHDACYVARFAPTGMIFVPCEGGISHNEIENAKPEDLEAGCNVLLHAVLTSAGVRA